MAEESVSYSADNDKKFREAVARAGAAVKDLTIPLTLISKDFYKSEMAIFQLQGPGQYPDLADSTKKQKLKLTGEIYPILRRSGALERSVTDPTDSQAINQIVGGYQLIIGTRVPYAAFHQSDQPRKKIPLRKFLFIGPEAPRFALSEQVGRLERWLGILDSFMEQKLTFGQYQAYKAGR